MNINGTMKELADISRIGEELAAKIDTLKDALKAYMAEGGTPWYAII